MEQRLIDVNELLGLLDEPTYSIGEVLSTIAVLSEIDPVHAAGGCRCGECKRWKPDGSYGIDLDGAKRPYGVCGVTHYCYKDNHFCSYGERREQDA